ncbi:MAG: AAA family ATPase [Clostridia bacterium]|nr:AAA family ATPase [Clostridia bacterium]
MQVQIKNIGIINDSKIDVNGLTIVTGKNNSGKTTLGKILYSLFYSKEKLFETATEDIIYYVEEKLSEVIRNSVVAMLIRKAYRKDNFEKDILYTAYRGQLPKFESLDEIQNYILCVCEELDNLTFSTIKEKYGNVVFSQQYKDEKQFKSEIDRIKTECKGIITEIEKLSDFNLYETSKIYKMLKREFNEQISPVRKSNAFLSYISLEDENDFFKIEIDNKKKDINVDGFFTFNNLTNVVFIDDTTVIDSVVPYAFRYKKYNGHYNVIQGIEDAISVIDHKYSLIYKLSENNSIVKSIIDSDAYDFINNEISSVFEEEIILKENKFICASDGLTLSNLATGSKMFAILKMLLSNGNLNSKTLLILDEPEAHLHPEWQNKLAEIIVLLVKVLNINVVITSHSSNFVLALQTYSIKHQIEDKTNFYLTTKNDDEYTVDYQKMNSKLNDVYVEFAKPFSEIKAKFDALRFGDENG